MCKCQLWGDLILELLHQVVKSDNAAATAGLIERIGNLPGTRMKNMKKHFLFVNPTIDRNFFSNMSYNFNVHVISPTEAGSLSQKSVLSNDDKNDNVQMFHPGNIHQITSLCPALGHRYALILPGMCDPYLQDPRGKTFPGKSK